MASLKRSSLQHRVWRWHFIAGLAVIPFAVILAITGAIYLFKPEFEASMEASINAHAPTIIDAAEQRSADEIIETALAQHPSSTLRRITLPHSPDDISYEIEVRTETGDRILWLDQHSGTILHDIPKSSQLMNFVKDIHGNLMADNRGSYVIELVASWMIVLILTGMFLWWPRNQAWWRMFIPQLIGVPKRETLRRLHGMGGAWIGGMILILLLSGLPWTQVWGDGFDRVSKAMGWNGPGQEWVITLKSSDGHAHDKGDGLNLWDRDAGDDDTVTLSSTEPLGKKRALSIQTIVESVSSKALPAPVEIQPPRGENGVWTARSMTQNRPERITIHYDKWTGDELMRIDFDDRHPVQQMTSYGIALHEGALFGWFNQLLGVITASGVVALSVTGGWMWWQRRPTGSVGVPPLPKNRKISFGVICVIGATALFLPLVAISLIAALAIESTWSLLSSNHQHDK